jgi:hypothetical protein
MQVADVVLADYAKVEGNGRFTLVGAGLESLHSAVFPFVVPSVYLLVKMKAAPSDVGINRLEVRLVGKGGPVIKLEGSMSVSDENADVNYIPVPFHFQDLEFRAEGRYEFQVFINGERSASLPLEVRYRAPMLT